MEGWNDFFVAVAGTSGALIGLLFVGLSINLKTILKFESLPFRGLKSVTLLFGALLISLVCLVPGQSPSCLGWELTALGLMTWAATTFFSWATNQRRLKAVEQKNPIANLMLLIEGQVATLCYVASGLVVTFGNPGGLYFLVVGMLLSLFITVMNSWVLLVEINR